MKKNIAQFGIILGFLMIILHFFPWATTDTKSGFAFSEGMWLLLTIPSIVTAIIAVIYFILFILLKQKKIVKIKLLKIFGIILSLSIIISVILNLMSISDIGFGKLIVGVSYSFGFGEEVSAGFGLYFLLIAAVLGSVISYIIPSDKN